MKKKTLLTLLCSLLITMLAFSLTACSGGSSEGSGTSGGSGSSEAETAEDSEISDESKSSENSETPEGEASTEAVVSFETVDIEGNTVKSEDVFSQHDITMINIWGTYCGPCIVEMPDLEVLNGRLAEKNCAIIGVVCDLRNLNDKATLKSAEDIISDTGVTYLNILPWETFFDDLPAQFIPTTYFVDSSGKIVGEAAVGARGANDYEALLNEVLGQI